MSDDTPTQRFPAAGDDATGEVQEDLQEEKKKSRGLLIGLIAAGALLLVAIIVLVVVLFPKGAGDIQAGSTQTPQPQTTDTPAPTETATPTPAATTEPTQEPEQPQQPQPTGPAFTSFNAVSQVSCSRGGPGFTPDPPSIQVSWATTRTVSVWIVMGTSDAADSGFMQLTNNGDQSDFAYPLQFPCFQASAQYTITLVGDDGSHVSKTWTVTNVGDRD
jgi:hypothetical protein